MTATEPATPTATAPPVQPLLVDIFMLAVLLGRSVASLERDQAAGRLPPPVRIGGSRKWRRADIEQWVSPAARLNRPAARSEPSPPDPRNAAGRPLSGPAHERGDTGLSPENTPMDHTTPPAAGNTRLSDRHREELAASAVPVEHALAAGVYTEPDPAVLGKLLGWKGPARAGGLVYPFLDVDGNPTGYVRVKPDQPLPDRAKPGKVRKYEAPKGQPSRLYIPPHSRTAVLDPTARLVVTEGLKQPLAADAAGFACVAVAGVWCGFVKRPAVTRGPRQLIPDLAGIAWAGRPVVLLFDSGSTLLG